MRVQDRVRAGRALPRREFLKTSLLAVALPAIPHWPWMWSSTDGETPCVRQVTVIGVGQGGTRIIDAAQSASDLPGVRFVSVDRPGWDLSASETKVGLDMGFVRGFYHGGDPQVGREGALQTAGTLKELLRGTECGVVVAALGGGTGTGGSPVIARILKELGALAFGVVTIPFSFEGPRRRGVAEGGVAAIQQEVDELIVYRNEEVLAGLPRDVLFPVVWQRLDEAVARIVKDRVRAEIFRRLQMRGTG